MLRLKEKGMKKTKLHFSHQFNQFLETVFDFQQK